MERRISFSCFLVAALLGAAPAAHAAMYRWVDDDGNITYSNQLPEDRGAAREVMTITPPKAPAPEPPKQAPQAAAAEASAKPSTPVPRVTAEAVQDPCLRSSDPKCYERNKDRYHPYLGYSPATQTRAVGTTSNVGAGGAVGGSFPAASR